MTPVLLHTNTKRIAEEKETLSNLIPIFQGVYDAVKAVEVIPTLSDIHNLVNDAVKDGKMPYVKTFVTFKLVDKSWPWKVNGVNITRAAAAGMIEIPDLTGIKAALEPVTNGKHQHVFAGAGQGARIDLMVLVKDVISAVPDADAQIQKQYSTYTKTDASADLATQLQVVCDALNAFNKAYNGFYAKRIPTVSSNQYGFNTSEIPGLAVDVNKTFIVDAVYIQRFESLGYLPNM